MPIETTTDVLKAYGKEQTLTQDISGSLRGRSVSPLKPHTFFGRKLHQIRYLFNFFHYKEHFNAVADEYLKQRRIVVKPPEKTVPPPKPPPPSFNKATEAFLNVVEQQLGNEGKELWKALLGHFLKLYSKDLCESFTQKGDTYVLKFPHRLLMHIKPDPSMRRYKGYPPEGVILELASDKTVEFTLSPETIHFKKGLLGFATLPLSSKPSQTAVEKIATANGRFVLTIRKWMIPMSFTAAFPKLFDLWSNWSFAIPDEADPAKILEKK